MPNINKNLFDSKQTAVVMSCLRSCPAVLQISASAVAVKDGTDHKKRINADNRHALAAWPVGRHPTKNRPQLSNPKNKSLFFGVKSAFGQFFLQMPARCSCNLAGMKTIK